MHCPDLDVGFHHITLSLTARFLRRCAAGLAGNRSEAQSPQASISLEQAHGGAEAGGLRSSDLRCLPVCFVYKGVSSVRSSELDLGSAFCCMLLNQGPCRWLGCFVLQLPVPSLISAPRLLAAVDEWQFLPCPWLELQ